ncbi:Limonene 1,2-monooxygenase [Frondihabitans sp. 762G35]|uniref:LLM class flavin-dependent oxidoreductase n=1 Tax=Frondihabitans sp. 762G35 TaxID=1446794 RepID=UPI000D208CD5|nr:LLM class flavin-dependent oxidoreductase [Frondihabitans sp. 762G35]ARC57802.1 Limonene 1,2-monooxygenase [Frondihabitans sp. 762G35]
MTPRVPLSVLDLTPVSTGRTATEALRDSLDLARRAEELGYRRFWLAEHHLNPGLAGSAPLAFLGLLARETSRIRVGTAAVLSGHHAGLQLAEAAGLVASLFDGRVDLGLGRSVTSAGTASAASPPAALPSPPAARVVDGLLLPQPVRVSPSRGRFGLLAELVDRGTSVPFEEVVTGILRALDGTFRGPAGDIVPILPAEGSGAEVWIHGSSGGESARLAGRLGLPFGANYHSTPTSVLDAVAAYRTAFVPGVLPRPHVIVSADALVAGTDAEAARLGLGFPQWVRSIRTGEGTIAYPSPEEALAAPLDAAAEENVRDRVDTRFVGSATTVVERLETLQRVTGADELLVTTLAHAHADRVRSYELLAEAWL